MVAHRAKKGSCTTAHTGAIFQQVLRSSNTIAKIRFPLGCCPRSKLQAKCSYPTARRSKTGPPTKPGRGGATYVVSDSFKNVCCAGFYHGGYGHSKRLCHGEVWFHFHPRKMTPLFVRPFLVFCLFEGSRWAVKPVPATAEKGQKITCPPSFFVSTTAIFS